MENFDKKKVSFLNDLNTQEKLLYSALGVVLIFGFIYFILPSFFKEKPISLSGRCGFTISPDNRLFQGFAFDGDSGKAYKNVKIHLLSKDKKSEYSFAIDPNRVERPDVAKTFSSPEAALSGFGVIIPRDLVPPGEYSVTLEQISDEGVRIYCSADGGPFNKIKIN
jgi:hypothetical protein